MEERPITDWLPLTKKEVEKRGWDELDVILISGDAYVDHPAFGTAVIGRIMESEGLKVGIVAQPNWKDDLRDFKKLGKPKYFFGVTAGCMDSMVNHYTANKRLRSNDSYTPGGEAGFRPDYATTVYTKILKEIYPDVPVLIGGIEASLRRVTHYDYWADKLFPSILVDSGADMLVYGMGEQPLREIMRGVKEGKKLGDLKTPLLLSVRSGARDSMPGMMDTILNLGLNDETVEALATSSGNARFAWDCYRRFIQMYGDVVMGVQKLPSEDHDPFEEIIEKFLGKMQTRIGVYLLYMRTGVKF